MSNSVLLLGGSSEERLVSVATAQNLASAYDFSEICFLHKSGALFKIEKDDLLKHERAFEVEFVPKGESFAPSIKQVLGHLKGKVVFLALHGTEGEDGTLQALFESHKIAFTGSDADSSRVCFDKVLSKRALVNTSIPLAPEFVFSKDNRDKSSKELTWFFSTHKKIVVKPVASGSSVGLQIVGSISQIPECVAALWSLPYENFIAEKFVSGRELTIGIYEQDAKLRALPPSEVVLNAGHSFDYQGKYLGRGTTEITPADLNDDDTKIVQGIALAAHQTLRCKGYSRTDLILSDSGPVYLETNTLPGLSKASFVPQQLKALNISLQEFIKNQLVIAEKRYL